MKPVIWDTFIFDREFDCLDIRLHELDGVAHRHVLIEADHTFQGAEKKCNFRDGRGAEYRDWPLVAAQIKLKGGRTPWSRETAQRQALLPVLEKLGAQPSDWVICSDADEIPSAKALSILAESVKDVRMRLPHKQISFDQHLCFYYVNNVCRTERWNGSQLMQLADLQKLTPQGARDLRRQEPSIAGGWHFCNLGDAEWLRNKIQSFSHAELNRPEITDLDYLDRMIRTRQVIEPPVDREMRFELDDAIPPDWVRDHRQDLYAQEVAA